MFERTKAIAASVTLTCMVVAPTVAHHAAVGYLEVERRVAVKAQKSKLAWLEMVGLQPKIEEHDIDALIDMAADEYGIPRPLFHALAYVESKKDPTAKSPKGAIGIVQVMPANAKRCGLPHPGKLWDERLNTLCGAQILSEELSTYGGDVRKALESYNGGPRCVGKCRESIQYADKVLSITAERYL